MHTFSIDVTIDFLVHVHCHLTPKNRLKLKQLSSLHKRDLFSAVILFCIGMVTVSQACLCFPSDTQDDICRAAIGKLHLIRTAFWIEISPFCVSASSTSKQRKVPESCLFVCLFVVLTVLRARVWSGPREAAPDEDDEFSSFYSDQVYSLKIVEIFKGEKEISHLPGVVSVGVRSPSLMVDLHTPFKFSSCSFQLHKGREYLLSGYVLDNELRSSFCDLRQKWTHVTPQQRAELNGHYNKTCQFWMSASRFKFFKFVVSNPC